jgi:hypothetical protein
MAPISEDAFELQTEVRDLYNVLDAALARDEGKVEDSEYGRELQGLEPVVAVLASFVEQRDLGWATDPNGSNSYVDRIGIATRNALVNSVIRLQRKLDHLLKGRVSTRDLHQLIES